MFNPLVKILGVIALVLATAVNAEEKDPFDITVYGSFIHTGTVPNALFFFNDIEQYDSFELRRAIRNHDINIVVLASDGGSVWEGLNMAGIIHDKGIATYVPKLPEKLGCYSACSFMFFGGKIRQADGILAVHQAGAYGSERDKASAKVSETQQNTQFTVSEIIGFLNEFETPSWVFEKMFRSRDFYFFDDDEKERLASRAEEISSENLYEINAFVSRFLKYIDNLSKEEKKADEEKDPEISEDEQLRLAVIEIQKLLNAVGCNAGTADGIWGRRTQSAAVLFAKTAKLPTSKEELISKAFVEALRKANKNFCPEPKNIGVSSFAKIYDASCGGRSISALVTISEVNLKNKTLMMTSPTGKGRMIWSGNILIDESGDKSKMKFNRNGFVYEIVLLGKIDCGNVTLRAR
jgi:hypothetical protein